MPPNGAVAFSMPGLHQLPEITVKDATGATVAGQIRVGEPVFVWKSETDLLPLSTYSISVQATQFSPIFEGEFTTTDAPAVFSAPLAESCAGARHVTALTPGGPTVSCQNYYCGPYSIEASEAPSGVELVIRWRPPHAASLSPQDLVAYAFIADGQPAPDTSSPWRASWDGSIQLASIFYPLSAEAPCFRLFARSLVTNEIVEGPQICSPLDPGAPPLSALDQWLAYCSSPPDDPALLGRFCRVHPDASECEGVPVQPFPAACLLPGEPAPGGAGGSAGSAGGGQAGSAGSGGAGAGSAGAAGEAGAGGSDAGGAGSGGVAAGQGGTGAGVSGASGQGAASGEAGAGGQPGGGSAGDGGAGGGPAGAGTAGASGQGTSGASGQGAGSGGAVAGAAGSGASAAAGGAGQAGQGGSLSGASGQSSAGSSGQPGAAGPEAEGGGCSAGGAPPRGPGAPLALLALLACGVRRGPHRRPKKCTR